MDTGLLESTKLDDISKVRDGNLLIYSEDITNPCWENFLGVKRTFNTNILDPFGQSYVKGVSGCASIYQNIFFNSYNSIDQYTFSFFVHQNSTTIAMAPYVLFSETNTQAYAGFIPQNGVLIPNSVGQFPIKPDSYASEYFGNGWYRYYLTVSQQNPVDLNIKFGVYYNGSNPDYAPFPESMIFWGAQLQKGNVSKNYYKTISTPIANALEEGFVKLENTEPSLGLPYVTNLLTNSQNPSSSSWKNFNLTLSANVVDFLSPISTFDVFKLIPTTQNSFHFLSQTVTLPSTGVPYTFSGYFREDKDNVLAYRYVSLMTCASAASADNYFRVQFNLDDGSITSYDGKNATLTSYSVTPAFSGWYRFNITSNLDYYKDVFCQIYVGQQALASLQFAGDGIRHIYNWGNQFEKGNNLTDYIETDSVKKSSVFYGDVWSSSDSDKSYYFLGAAGDNKSYENSRRFTGSDGLFLSGKNLSYNCKTPRHDFDIYGDLHALSAFFDKLSTNNFLGETLSFNGFDKIIFDSKITGNKRFLFNKLSAQQVILLTKLSALSTLYVDSYVPSICANRIFSSINWNVTAAGYVSARNIIAKKEITTPFLSAQNSYFVNLSCNNSLIYNNLTSLSSIYTSNIHGLIEYDSDHFYYTNENLLTTRLSASYFLGIKPSDSKSTDNISLTRTISGEWDGSNGSIIETFPVLKPYFKNIRQALKYVEKAGLYGEDLNILVYEDISQNNINIDSSISDSGCEYSGNINVRYYGFPNVPTFLSNAGFKAGDYVWNKNNNSENTGKITYWNVDRLKFSNLNFYGMYEIGSVINFNSKKQYTNIKPYNQAPRKISFRTYVCSNTALPVGSFGANLSDWKNMYYKSDAKIAFRPISFNNDEMDVNIHNLCFEFDTNANDSTCLYFKSGNSYLSNVTVAALGLGNYAYGAILAWPKSTIYVCGENQIDPYLLSPSRWNNWNLLQTATNQNYFPGYGLAIVGNSTTGSTPTFFSNAFINAWRSKIYFMDFQNNRRIGRFTFHNASIILDGKFTANSFYSLKDHAKIYANNHVFRSNNFYLSNLNCTYFTSPNSYPYLNTFQTQNRDNFYYLNFEESNSTFIPHNFEFNFWRFKESDGMEEFPANGIAFTSKLVNTQNPKYIFETNNINLSGMVYGDFQKNSLKVTNLPVFSLNDNTKLFNYIDPNQLGYYNLSGLYLLSTPIANGFDFVLSYY